MTDETQQSRGLDLGDVVEHREFGIGTVVGVDGETITVHFEQGAEKRVIGSFLYRVKPGYEKGIRYWYGEWQALVREWQAARSDVEAVVPGLFRPRQDEEPLDQLLQKLKACEDAEQAAREKIEAFLEEENLGNHR